VFVAYYVFIPYRLIVEYRKRFYYQRKHALLKQVEELKTNFISMMSHDIKTPIAKIQGIAEGGLMRSKDLEQSKAFQSIISSSTDLTQFVNRILNLSKIESGALKLEFTSKDINALVHECISDVEFLAQKRSIKIRTDLEPMFSVPMDPSLIKQVIQNLLDNALKYSPEGSTVTVRTRETPTAVEFTIVDEGEGIEEADLQHVFEKFYRPQTSLAKTTMGTGLGLYLVKYFVELHKGNVTASSAPGRGSTFSFSLPVVTTEGSEIGRSQHV
jgi:signal transduction histidine kinase